MWAMMSSSADAFTEAYTAVGGVSTVVRLPEEGITGNSHFMFQELNNDVIADHVEAWIEANAGKSNDSAPASNDNVSQGGKTLVAYFSASGNTKAVAEYIAAAPIGNEGLL